MKKVILINNFNLKKAIEQWHMEGKVAPTQHLWGCNFLKQYGFSVDVLPFERFKWIKKIGNRIKFLGDLDQQLRILQRLYKYDAIYSAHHLSTALFSLMKIFGFLKKPLITIAYQSFRPGSFLGRLFTLIFVKGNDKILCLSDAVLQDFRALGVPRKKLDVIEWGCDLNFYPSDKRNANMTRNIPDKIFIISPGKTYRDWNTLVRAFKYVKCDLEIYAFGDQPFRNNFKFPSNIRIANEKIHWSEIIQKYQKAYAVVIPILMDSSRLNNAIGLTTLMESFAMGKPVIMTRNEFVGVDLETEGAGIWVEPGDSDGWIRAATYLLDNPKISEEMGRRARQLAVKKFNMDSFSKKLAYHLVKVI